MTRLVYQGVTNLPEKNGGWEKNPVYFQAFFHLKREFINFLRSIPQKSEINFSSLPMNIIIFLTLATLEGTTILKLSK